MPIIREAGEFIDNVHMIDLNQYGMHKVCSSFLVHWDDSTVIPDCGTSDDYRKILTYMKKHNISRESVKYIVPSHHHFDHSGGASRILKKLEKYNPSIKILTTDITKSQLQNPEKHMKAAASTYSDWVGKMDPIADNYFQVIEPDTIFQLDEDEKLELMLFSSPGHTYDHVCPTIFKKNLPVFSYFGEASGTLFNAKDLLTLPTSMPTEFNYEKYMNSVKRIKELGVINAGFCHFGAITTAEDVNVILDDQISFLPIFRDFVKTKYEEFQSTKPVVNAVISDLFVERSSFHRSEGLSEAYKGISTRNALALVYGMLVDLGYKKNKY